MPNLADLMESLGEEDVDTESAELVEWLVKVGDKVDSSTTVCQIQFKSLLDLENDDESISQDPAHDAQGEGEGEVEGAGEDEDDSPYVISLQSETDGYIAEICVGEGSTNIRKGTTLARQVEKQEDIAPFLCSIGMQKNLSKKSLVIAHHLVAKMIENASSSINLIDSRLSTRVSLANGLASHLVYTSPSSISEPWGDLKLNDLKSKKMTEFSDKAPLHEYLLNRDSSEIRAVFEVSCPAMCAFSAVSEDENRFFRLHKTYVQFEDRVLYVDRGTDTGTGAGMGMGEERLIERIEEGLKKNEMSGNEKISVIICPNDRILIVAPSVKEAWHRLSYLNQFISTYFQLHSRESVPLSRLTTDESLYWKKYWRENETSIARLKFYSDASFLKSTMPDLFEDQGNPSS